jgi:hypothetical protein
LTSCPRQLTLPPRADPPVWDRRGGVQRFACSRRAACAQHLQGHLASGASRHRPGWLRVAAATRRTACCWRLPLRAGRPRPRNRCPVRTALAAEAHDEDPGDGIGSPGELEVRLSDLPPGRLCGVAGLAGGPPRPRSWRVGGVVEEGERTGSGSLRGPRRGGHLFRVDRFDGEHPRRRACAAVHDAAQAQEWLDTVETSSASPRWRRRGG